VLGACRGVPAEPGATEPTAPPATFAPIPNPELVSQDGRRLRFYDDLVRGKTVLIQFFFTTCEGSCPGTTAKLAHVREELGERFGRDVSFLSITLDPERDTPPVLADYAALYGAGEGWLFLTGSPADIESLRRRLGVYDLDPVIDADRTQHAGVVVLGNDRKQRWFMEPATLPAHFLAERLLRLAGSNGS